MPQETKPKSVLAAARNITGLLHHTRYNLAISVICIATLTALDLGYNAMNANYIFDIPEVFQGSFFFTCLIVFLGTFLSRPFFVAFLGAVFALSVFQLVNFEYFGSYILPIHFIQLAPDFLLIMASLVEVIHEIVPLLAMAAVGLVLLTLALRRVSRGRVRSTRAGLIIVILLGSDFAGNFFFIEKNKQKLGEPAFIQLFPDTNRLAIDNAYRSLRYLTVGILPDRMTGGRTEYPALPEPAIVSTPDVNIVLILSETVRAESLSVLGYEKKTTPLLEQVDGFFAKSVFSAGTMTRTSFAGLMNRLKYPGVGKQFLSQSNCLFRLAKQNGFKTHFIYAYDQQMAGTLLPLMCANSIDSVRVSDDAPSEKRPFDLSLPHHVENIDFDQPNFIVIGPKGAHTPYDDKSPADFKIFEIEYDNALHYGDHVIAGLIDQMRRLSSKPTYVIYTSDHGELLKGEYIKRGHGWFKNQVFRVPLLFLPINVDAPEAAIEEVAKAQSHFDIATFILGLMGYDVAIQETGPKEIYINGSDLSGLAGYLRLEYFSGQLMSVDLLNGFGAVPGKDEFRLN